MAKHKTENLEIVNETKPQVKPQKVYTLKSRANYIIEIIEENKHKFIQPYGKLKVNKDKLKLTNDSDAKFLTFMK